MNDPPLLLKPTRLSWGHSPTRHRGVGDDILSYLAPASAVDALGSATGALRRCLDGASAAEREFAMRTASASKTIWEWADELTDWNWPSKGGPGGFESPRGKHDALSFHITSPDGEPADYMGSLLVDEVTRYEIRIEEIHRGMEKLDMEEIKRHVLTNHILPLSRPSTPASFTGRSSMPAVPGYNKMEDLSAIITAIVVQTLPNMARLSRLLQVWSIRIGVLHRVPPLLLSIEDAEIALKSGWHAISLQSNESKRLSQRIQFKGSTLSQDDFEIMRRVLAKKVSKPGRTLDYMLDCLEGLQDTLPDSWLDRMESVERDYGEWVATCERKIREADWARSIQAREEQRSRTPDQSPVGRARFSNAIITSPSPLSDKKQPIQDEDGLGYNGATATTPLSPIIDDGDSSDVDTMDNSVWSPEEDSRTFNQTMSPVYEKEDEKDELELPPLRDSHGDMSPTPIHGASNHFFGMSSDLPEVSASPFLPRGRMREIQFPDDSPPSSPPLPRDARESSVLLDSPLITSIPEGQASTPLDGSFAEDFDDSYSISEVTRPMSRRESSGDQQLRQQISQIIEGIPAKIKLSAETPTINLNPPDLQLPRLKKKPSREAFKRSTSNMSSRTTTPSFTLSPAKNTRPRYQRGQQDIKVYHLSRSTGEPPIKLFIRCVGEHGERVMVRVGGGWADLSEYLKDYASHHKRRSVGTDTGKVEIRDLPNVSTSIAANSSIVIESREPSPPSRPGSAMDRPITPLRVRKTRRSQGAANIEIPRLRPKTPAVTRPSENAPSSEESTLSRSSSRQSWVEDDSSFLGLAGPSGKKVEMSDENKAWVESVKEKVRLASGERKPPPPEKKKQFGELGKVGGTKRLFRKKDERKA